MRSKAISGLYPSIEKCDVEFSIRIIQARASTTFLKKKPFARPCQLTVKLVICKKKDYFKKALNQTLCPDNPSNHAFPLRMVTSISIYMNESKISNTQ